MKNKVGFVFLLILSMCFFGIVKAYDPTSSSENYQLYSQTDFSETNSNSQNYNMNGILTDINDVGAYGGDSEITEPQKIVSTPTIELQKSADLDFLSNITDFLNSPLANDLALGLLAFATLAGLLNALASLLLNLPWLNPWFFLGWTKKKKPWGTVYDAENNQPIPLAQVRIFDFDKQKLLATDTTDRDGRFAFILGPGKYYLQAIKKHYSFPAKMVLRDYHQEPVEISDSDHVMLDINIPMDPEIHTLGKRINTLIIILNIFSALRIPVMIIGTILSVALLTVYQDFWHYLAVGLYIVLWLNEIYQLRRVRNYGIVASLDNKELLPYTIIRLIDQKTGKLYATRVSNQNGKYLHLVEPGEYTLISTKENFEQFKIKDLIYKKGDSVKRDIYLERKNA